MEKEQTNLQKLRIKKGLSQSQLAAKSGVTLRMVQSYEQRDRHIEGAKLDSLCSLALSLDCKIEDILDDKTLIEKFKLAK